MGVGIIKKAIELVNLIKRQENIVIISHGDADGVAGSAIASILLKEIGIEHEIKFVKYLNGEIIDRYKDDFILFIDVGNGNIEEIIEKKVDCVIVDHHFCNKYFKNSLNPFYYGIDGSNISASGLMHLIARNVKGDADIALIGAIGDLQDLKSGLNQSILKESNIKMIKDIKTYGRNMPLYKMLSYSPLIPPFFKNVRMVIKFLRRNGINEKKSWKDLDKKEKRLVFSEIVKTLIKRGYDYEYISNLYGEVYELNGIDIREIASIINSLAKYEKYEMALDTCITKNFKIADKFLNIHRKNIKNGIKLAKENLNDGNLIKYFHGGNLIRDTILGTITGMLLDGEKISKPIIGFVESDNEIKVSARAPKNLNINLSLAIKNAANKLGGYGGGHKAAAGAIIPRGYEEEFIQFFEHELINQLNL